MMNEYTYLKVADDPSLEKMPPQFPNLMNLTIYDLNNSVENNNPKIKFHLHSLKNLPKNLPKLKNINIYNSRLPNFEDLKSEIPALEGINISDCHIHNFYGFPKFLKSLYIRHSNINSFEGIDLRLSPSFDLQNCTIHSLGGISRSALSSILIAYFLHDDDGPEDNTLKLTEKGRQLFYDSINPEIYSTYNPLNLYKWVDNVHGMIWQRETRYNLPHREWDSEYEFYKWNWIYGFHLEKLLFIPENLELLHQYYHKTTRQLAQEYITNPESLPLEQIERLVHEVDPEIRKMLENNLPPDNPILSQISTKFTFKTQNGLKIIK